MNKIFQCSWLLALLLGAQVAVAQDLKIGVVNASLVLDESPQKTAALSRLEQEFASRARSLEGKQKSLREASEKLQRDAAVLTAEQLQAQERKLINDQRELARLEEEYSEDLMIRRNEELRKLEEVVAQAIIDLAIQDNYDLVVYQGIIFASDRIDMTEKVLELLKSRAK